MLASTLKSFWTLLALTPFLIYRGNGVGLNQAGLNTFVAIFFYGLGWVVLLIALKRDPDGRVLASFARSTQARIVGVVAVLFLQFVGFAVSGLVMFIAFLGMTAFLFGLWATCRSGEVFIQRTEKLLLMSASFFLMMLMMEYFLRLPGVVARTGGDTPGMARWAEKNYDKISDATPMGVRSFHLDAPKPNGTFRIVTLGDSYTWGSKIGRTQDLWPYALERTLNRKDRPVQVINLGRPGFTTVNEAEMLDKMGWEQKPDLVILEFTLNDTIPSGPNFFHESEDWYFRLMPLLPVVHRTLDDRSYLYSFLNSRFRGLQMQRRYKDGYTPLFANDFGGWQACQEAFQKIGKQSKERNVPVVGMIFPMFLPGKMDEAKYLYAPVHRKVKAAMENAGIPALDLFPVYAKFGRNGRSWWALPCDAHPSVEGHKVAAEAMAKKLGEWGLVP